MDTQVKKILVCDDEPHILESVTYVVRKLGFECLTALNGEDGLHLAKTERPDLLILDVRMPKLNGFEVCAQLKGDEATRGIYIIMLTAFGQKQDEQSAEAAGADEFMAKPFSPRWLKTRLGQVLGAEERMQ